MVMKSVNRKLIERDYYTVFIGYDPKYDDKRGSPQIKYGRCGNDTTNNEMHRVELKFYEYDKQWKLESYYYELDETHHKMRKIAAPLSYYDLNLFIKKMKRFEKSYTGKRIKVLNLFINDKIRDLGYSNTYYNREECERGYERRFHKVYLEHNKAGDYTLYSCKTDHTVGKDISVPLSTYELMVFRNKIRRLMKGEII